MKVSRRTILLGGGLALLPWPAMGAVCAPAAQPYAIGELWGMPYVARGAQGLAIRPRAMRQGTPFRTFELA